MQDIRIRPILSKDNGPVAEVIRQVLTEYGLNREGFAFVDTELDDLYEHYLPPSASYFVAEINSRIVGGAGFAPLLGGDRLTAELKKMYLLPEARGLGIGGLLMRQLLPLAKETGYTQIYLETVPEMKDAVRLYKKYGFHALAQALGSTGHFGCQSFFIRSLL